MALGFGFNKTKILAAAEKAVQQGKLQNAISEYEKIIKEDPKDLNILNTVGDLNARIGNNDKAAVYFKKVGDIYATEGFTVKAIAVYKKIAKLNPSAHECTLKLAELYTQQGLYNDARSQYVQLADHFMKEGNLEEAAKIFQKILELDPENTAMQTKLADLYIKLGRKENARDIFLNASQALYSKGALDAADESLRKVISLDPENMEAVLLRGKIAADSGDSSSAVMYLEKVPNIDSRPDALRALMHAYLQSGRLQDAEGLAQKLMTAHNDASGLSSYADSLMAAGSVDAALRVYDRYYDKLLAVNPTSTIEALLASMNKLAGNVQALEMLRGIFVKAGEHNRINEVSEALAQACVHSGDFKKAAEIYKELADIEPENPLHLQNYRQLQGKMGKDPTVRELSREAGEQALMVDELEHQAPVLPQSYPDTVREAVKAALTEAELFESYSMATKAIAPLEAALQQAPEDAQLNQRLASLYARSGRMKEAIERCQVLQKAYREAGFSDQAKQYAEMAKKYAERVEEAAKAASVEFDASFMPGGEIHMPPEARPGPPPPPAPAAAPTPEFDLGQANTPAFGLESEVASPPPAAASAASAPEFSIDVPAREPQAFPVADMQAAAAEAPAAPPAPAAHEIDLSDWEQMAESEAPAAPPPSIDEWVEEAQFYLSQSFWKEAGAAIEKIAAAAPNAPQLARLRQLLEAGSAQPAASGTTAPASGSVAEISFDAAPVEAPAPPKVAPPPPAPIAAPPQPVAKAAEFEVAPPHPAKKEEKKKEEKKGKELLSDFVLDLEDSLGDDFSVGKAPAPPPAPKPQPAPQVAAKPQAAPAAAARAASAAPQMAAPAPAMMKAGFAHPDASAALSDMFAEFKEDVEETSDQAEDPDTHYNLGVAFKEMGLLDEAIGELQKVCHAIDKGLPFGQVMQAYTWLAHCFLEKGAPLASVKWYEKALTVPAIDEESKMAVYYELGSAYEAAGKTKEALENFNEVYSNNIDYRDVAERIKALRP